MQAVLKESKQFKHALEWCLIGSLLIHASIVLFTPKPTYEKPPVIKQEIQIELVKETPPAPALPAAEPQPTPPTPEPPKPQPVKPPPKPVEPKPTEQKPVPQKASPVVEPPSEPTRAVAEAPAPAVITAKPTASESKSEVVVPPPAQPAPPAEPPKATGPSEGDIEAARNAFRNAAHRELKKNQRYPRIAQDRGIEGDVRLKINIDDHGDITGIEVVESSGNKAIDDAALAAAQKSQLKPHFNEILRGKINNIIVTVSFKLSS
ncbi:energy transducer TonB [Methylophilus flavus]|uniref:Energy transducer TonB n=1 Tax=Methylophilus flavus TaxID=640084 RepID=A0ABW3PF71_9PROT